MLWFDTYILSKLSIAIPTNISPDGKTPKLVETPAGVIFLTTFAEQHTKTFPAGDYQVSCALIIGKRKASTDLKTSLNDALRDFNVAV